MSSRAGLWPFLAAQIVLIWIWYALHAKRLRDAGKPAGLAVAACLLYALSVVLLVIVAGAFYGALAGQGTDPNTASALGLILFVSIIAMLSGAPHHDSLAWLIVAILLVIAFLPIVLAVVTSVGCNAADARKGPPRDVPLRLRLEHEPRGHAPARARCRAHRCRHAGKLSLSDHRRWLCFGRAAARPHGLRRVVAARRRATASHLPPGRISPAGFIVRRPCRCARRAAAARVGLSRAARKWRPRPGRLHGSCDRGRAGVAIAAAPTLRSCEAGRCGSRTGSGHSDGRDLWGRDPRPGPGRRLSRLGRNHRARAWRRRLDPQLPRRLGRGGVSPARRKPSSP